MDSMGVALSHSPSVRQPQHWWKSAGSVAEFQEHRLHPGKPRSHPQSPTPLLHTLTVGGPPVRWDITARDLILPFGIQESSRVALWEMHKTAKGQLRELLHFGGSLMDFSVTQAPFIRLRAQPVLGSETQE